MDEQQVGGQQARTPETQETTEVGSTKPAGFPGTLAPEEQTTTNPPPVKSGYPGEMGPADPPKGDR